MASTSDKLVAPKGDDMTPERVEAFLRDHPDFLARRPALADRMAPPQRHLGDNVMDLQAFLIGRLRDDRADARGAQDRLVERARSQPGVDGDRVFQRGLANALIALGSSYFVRSMPARSNALLEEGVALAEEVGVVKMRVFGLNMLLAMLLNQARWRSVSPSLFTTSIS